MLYGEFFTFMMNVDEEYLMLDANGQLLAIYGKGLCLCVMVVAGVMVVGV